MASIWKNGAPSFAPGPAPARALSGHLGIEFLEAGDDYLRARMPVDERTVQPAGVLHGGASVALAETVMSAAAGCCVDRDTHTVVGLEINANHVGSVRTGFVIATARPVHIGASTHVWEARIEEAQTGRLVCVARMTAAILSRTPSGRT